METIPPCCGVCSGSFAPKERYVRRHQYEQPAHLACADLASFLAEWLYDDGITFAEVWRLWSSLQRHTENHRALAKGMQLVASIEHRLSVFGESPPQIDA